MTELPPIAPNTYAEELIAVDGILQVFIENLTLKKYAALCLVAQNLFRLESIQSARYELNWDELDPEDRSFWMRWALLRDQGIDIPVASRFIV